MDDIKRIPLFGKCPDLTPEELKEMDEDIKAERQEEALREKVSCLSKKRKLTPQERAELDEATAAIDGF